MTRRDSDAARVRRGEVLRGVPADRGDGASRRRHAAVRSDEAGRPRRSADRPRAVRGRAASPGQSRGRSLQPGWFPDADEMGRAGARAAADSRPGAGGIRAVRHGPPQHLRERPDGAARHVAGASAADLFFAGQMSGVEGTWSRRRRVCSPGRTPPALARGEPPSVPPRTTAIGALAYYVRTPIRALRAVEHHVRDHAAAGTGAARQDGAQTGAFRASARGSAGMVREHLDAFLEYLQLNENASVTRSARAKAIFPNTCRFFPSI